MMTRFFFSMAALSLILAAETLFACDTPVYRYALEKWSADPYHVFLFSNGPLTANQKAVLHRLRDQADTVKGQVNVVVRHVNLASASAVEKRLWKATGATNDTLAVFPTQIAQAVKPIWQGPITMQSAAAIYDSPLRKQLAAELLDKEASGIWLICDGPNAKANQAAEALVRKQFSAIKAAFTPPKNKHNTSADKTYAADASPIEPPTKPEKTKQWNLNFSVLHLPHQTTPEPILHATVRQLGNLKTLLRRGPVIIPIFGRGRALAALHGENLTAKSIQQAGRFLIGPCACEIKAQNPGLDLLMRGNWAKVKQTAPTDIELPPLTGLAPINPTDSQEQNEAPPAPPDWTPGDSEKPSSVPQPPIPPSRSPKDFTNHDVDAYSSATPGWYRQGKRLALPILGIAASLVVLGAMVRRKNQRK